MSTMKWNLGVSVSLKNCVEKQLHSSAFVEKIWKVGISISHDFGSILKRFSFDVPFRLLDRFRIDLESMIHRFWNGFHFWLRPILDRFLIDCWSILNCIFSFLQKSRKHAQNAKRTGHSSQFFVHEKRTFPFSEYHINAFKLAVYFTRNVDLPFNVWSFWIDCWTPSAIENNSHETHPKNQHSAH